MDVLFFARTSFLVCQLKILENQKETTTNSRIATVKQNWIQKSWKRRAGRPMPGKFWTNNQSLLTTMGYFSWGQLGLCRQSQSITYEK